MYYFYLRKKKIKVIRRNFGSGTKKRNPIVSKQKKIKLVPTIATPIVETLKRVSKKKLWCLKKSLCEEALE